VLPVRVVVHQHRLAEQKRLAGDPGARADVWLGRLRVRVRAVDRAQQPALVVEQVQAHGAGGEQVARVFDHQGRQLARIEHAPQRYGDLVQCPEHPATVVLIDPTHLHGSYAMWSSRYRS
jgi:hypothetical protein